MTRPRLARLQHFARDLSAVARRRRRADERPVPDRAAAEELARRLDATRERLRRDIPPADESR